MRRIPKNYLHITGQMSSRQGQALGFEGGVEKDFYAVMEHQPSITRIDTQQITIQYRSGGRKRNYTPEALISFCPSLGRSPILAEVKDRETLRKEFADFRERFGAAIRFGRENGYEFRIYTEVEIRTPYLANLRLLRIHRDHEFSERIAWVKEIVQQDQAINFRTALELLEKKEHERAVNLSLLYHSLSRNHISANLFYPLGYETRLHESGHWEQRPWDKRWLRAARPQPPPFRRGW